MKGFGLGDGFRVHKWCIAVQNENVVGVRGFQKRQSLHNGMAGSEALALPDNVGTVSDVALQHFPEVSDDQDDVFYAAVGGRVQHPVDHGGEQHFGEHFRPGGFHAFSLAAGEDNGTFLTHC